MLSAHLPGSTTGTGADPSAHALWGGTPSEHGLRLCFSVPSLHLFTGLLPSSHLIKQKTITQFLEHFTRGRIYLSVQFLQGNHIIWHWVLSMVYGGRRLYQYNEDLFWYLKSFLTKKKLNKKVLFIILI